MNPGFSTEMYLFTEMMLMNGDLKCGSIARPRSYGALLTRAN
jgi:hypothetical protein